MGSHKGAPGARYSRHFRALESRWGPFDPIAREYAAAVSALFVAFRSATETLQAAQATRERSGNRRPHPKELERLKKRQGMAFRSYDQALTRLEALSGGAKKPMNVAEVLARRGEAP